MRIGTRSRKHGKRKWNAAFAAVFALLSVPLLADSPDRDEFRRTFQKTVPLRSGQRLRIDHSNGKVQVRTSREAQVSISATIRVSSSDQAGAQKFSEQIRIRVDESPAGVSVVTEYPEKKWTFIGGGFVSYSVDYEIVMPETAPLEVRNKFGNVDVDGLKAAADVKNSNGDVAFRNGKGAQRIENSFGKIDVTNNEGNATVVNSNGRVTVRD